MKIFIDRAAHEVGDISALLGRELREIGSVPPDFNLWREDPNAGSRPIDIKVNDDDLVHLGADFGPAPRFHTAPKVI